MSSIEFLSSNLSAFIRVKKLIEFKKNCYQIIIKNRELFLRNF